MTDEMDWTADAGLEPVPHGAVLEDDPEPEDDEPEDEEED